MPQKQPPANTAVAWPEWFASGTSNLGAGTGTDAVPPPAAGAHAVTSESSKAAMIAPGARVKRYPDMDGFLALGWLLQQYSQQAPQWLLHHRPGGASAHQQRPDREQVDRVGDEPGERRP